MTTQITIDVKGLLPLKKQLELLALPRLQRKKLLKYVAYKLIRDTRRRVRQRVDLDGKPFSNRPDGWKDKHEIDRLARFLAVTKVSDTSSEIGWRRSSNADLAKRIQYGSKESVNDEKVTDMTKFNSENAPATRWQARALVANGFRQPKKNGGKGKLATVRWIRGAPTDDGRRKNWNISAKMASIVLTSMRKSNFKKARRQDGIDDESRVTIPARSFLGATQREINVYLVEMMNKYTKEVKNGRR